MCWIIWYYCPTTKDSHKETLKRLFYFSKIRWLHAFWIAYETNAWLISKKFRTVEALMNFTDEMYYLPNKIIWHNRYSTSWDYKEMENNQPLLKLWVWLVFNWIISQKDKAGMENEFWKKLATYNDWEVVLNKILDWEVEEFFEKHDCSFSGLRIKDWKLFAYTNGKRPAYCFEKDGWLFFCSTLDIMKRAVWEVNYFELKPFNLYEAKECLEQI